MTMLGVRPRLQSWICNVLLTLLTATGILIFLNLGPSTGTTLYSHDYVPYELNPPIETVKLLEVDQKKERYFLVIGIPTMTSHTAQRTAIRRTWRNVSRWAALKDVQDHYKQIKLMFLFGKLENQTFSEEFKREMKENDDMYVINGLQEGRLVLKYKVLWALKRSLTFDYDYFVKTDDDIFVNLPLMLQSLIMSPRERVYTGGCLHAYGGWGGYPTWKYCSGGGYVLSRDVVMAMEKLPQEVHNVRFKPEDAYTGWMVHKLNTLTDFKVKVFNQGLLKVGMYKCGPFIRKWFYHYVRPYKMESFFQMIDQNIYEPCPKH